jgi:hypothetical protein
MQQPVRLQFAANLETANALGFTVLLLILLRADEVIEQFCDATQLNGHFSPSLCAAADNQSPSGSCEGQKVVPLPLATQRPRECRLGVISGSADHVDGLPRTRPVYLS